jgi:hypothetical protein
LGIGVWVLGLEICGFGLGLGVWGVCQSDSQGLRYTASHQDPALGTSLGPNGGPRGAGGSCEKGTPVGGGSYERDTPEP